jgi:hypothetical protein
MKTNDNEETLTEEALAEKREALRRALSGRGIYLDIVKEQKKEEHGSQEQGEIKWNGK